MRLLVVLAMLLSAAPAAAQECNVFAFHIDPNVTVTDDIATVTVKDANGTRKLDVTIMKLHGQLISAAIDGEDLHYFQYVQMDGEKTLLWDSQLFREACSVTK